VNPLATASVLPPIREALDRVKAAGLAGSRKDEMVALSEAEAFLDEAKRAIGKYRARASSGNEAGPPQGS